MFSKILIANRGEIACRIQRTARALGVRTVAVYSDVDAGALHVEAADEAVCIGPAAASESYLRGDRIIEAAVSTGAEAIHPGYGFLSENAAFAEAVSAAGLVFIGPPASAITAMGLKDAAKARMEAAGVPVVPGYHGASQDPETLAYEAERIGYPVLIKARAGGGGKGMRLVSEPGAFAASLAAAQREAQASFGDAACLIEKFITSPRHIEIQVFADVHGNAVYLHERDCSLQRRHQKVIEEAPAPGMSDTVRAAMGEAAVTAAREIGYVGAGTIEFIADGSDGLRTDGFWFMEMNTRLQVEHPVTEAITGQDLVDWQLRVAAGEPLPLSQHEIPLTGWAVEARLYAEDPQNDFLPASGPIHHLSLPDTVRVDTGVRAGDSVSTHYDPMIAKVIAHAADRMSAFRDLACALDASELAGTTCNIDFLAALCRNPSVRDAQLDTGLIARDIDALTAPNPARDEARAVAAVVALGLGTPQPHEGFRLWVDPRQHCVLDDNGDTRVLEVRVERAGAYAVRSGDAAPVSVERLDGAWRVGPSRRRAHCHAAGEVITVFLDGHHRFSVPDPERAAADAALGGDQITAPMPGLVRALDVAVGDRVSAGDTLAVMEAMKMEHALPAPRDGVVDAVHATVGDQLDQGAVLISLAADAEPD
ncbi:MAG: biotin carboxylase N-terminal domain-containing protein [Pseudomonadota bacterium]